jgi:ATP-dependent helicase/nuclease subunit A
MPSDLGAGERAELEEERRLLYVAMTRAIERLVVCGVDGGNKRPEGCWYDLSRDALEEHCVIERADDGTEDVLRYRKVPDNSAPAAAPVAVAATPSEIPAWLHEPVAPGAPPIAPIKPSGFVDDPEAAEMVRPGEVRQRAILRGNIVHRLMQSLPDIPLERRADAARHFIERQNTDFSVQVREEIASQVLTILADPRFASLFGPDSRAEVPIVGRINGRLVNGVVDRLVVAPDAIRIADYKTNRPAPRSLAETKGRYQRYIVQLALYRAVLMQLYPDRPVRAALVWTALPSLGEIPAEDLDAALSRPHQGVTPS